MLIVTDDPSPHCKSPNEFVVSLPPPTYPEQLYALARTPPDTTIPPANVELADDDVTLRRFVCTFPTNVDVAVVDATLSDPANVDVPVSVTLNVDVPVNIPALSIPIVDDDILDHPDTYKFVVVASVDVDSCVTNPPLILSVEDPVLIARKSIDDTAVPSDA